MNKTEDRGFQMMRFATGGLEQDSTGGLEGVEIGATALGAIFGFGAIVGFTVGASWLRRKTVNTYVGTSRALSEGDGDEPPRRRPIVIETSYAPPARRAAAPMTKEQIVQRARGIAERRGMIAPYVVVENNRVVVIGVDPLPEFEEKEMVVSGSPSTWLPKLERYTGMKPLTGGDAVRQFEIPLSQGKFGAPSTVSNTTPSMRSLYREKIPASAFGGEYPWEKGPDRPVDYEEVLKQYRAWLRSQRAKGSK